MPVTPTGVPKPRKPRPSRARGLRTTTGCLTCRRRRVKCDELRPRCATCTKSDRECQYTSATENSSDFKNNEAAPALKSTPSSQSDVTTAVASPKAARQSLTDTDSQVFSNSPELFFDTPLSNVNSVPSPNSAPLEWYDLLAEDAINNIDKYNLNLDLDRATLSRRQSPIPDSEAVNTRPPGPRQDQNAAIPLQEQWNSTHSIPLNNEEFMLLQHFVDVIGPILDLCDVSKQFTTVIPGLAVRNVGLLKSLLAVSARHLALINEPQMAQLSLNTSAPIVNAGSNGLAGPLMQVATHYYYETLHYLSKNLLYPSYSKSREIVSTSILISTYEMLDSSNSNGAWERHLRGIFWIQRSQNNNGECKDPLRQAAWWQWLRQDTWVAFREGRRVLTIWRPTKRLMDLSPDELCLRIIYICGRCVDFAANEKKYDISIRIDQGGRLLQALEDWHGALPSSFRAIHKATMPDIGSLFAPLWVHPPSYAAAIQTFHFARIIVLINQPSKGGMDDFRVRQRYLDESVETICGIAMMHLERQVHQRKDLPSAFVNYQALYAAGLCVQNPVKQTAILHLLERTLDITKFPPKTLLSDLASYWRAGS
ncbi:hypothetical protein ACN47E_000592 [Coniothyrium glycines]